MKVATLTTVGLGVVLIVTVVVSLAIGTVAVPVRGIFELLLGMDSPSLSSTEQVILMQLRLPRIFTACVVGGALGVAGAGYQGLFRNPLADPFVIGASSGAGLGVTIAIILGLQWTIWGVGAISLAALLGAITAVAAVFGIATAGRRVPTLSLLLAGVALSSLISAIMSLLMFINDEKLVAIFGWLMGSLSGKSWSVVWTAGGLAGSGIVVLWGLSRALDALTFGEETAASLGLSLKGLRFLVVLAASTATAAAVAAAGVIGFVGLIAPHIARSLVGARHVHVIPASALVGAILLLVADDVARTVVAPAELPVGVVTALLGGPFFLYLLKTRQEEFVAQT
ncbi:FecCD family ABC transporter permease [Candidatus Laterigemmans baculatus]|uniref:FecCD family ABC transporter permease n=1 Tax=Candidatus Laterigemmans baculatus TaxID=2770505 RepID=UPI0013DA3178|nr:iron ABC transporter permease [Candidatus Laterigemmans baculatus]